MVFMCAKELPFFDLKMSVFQTTKNVSIEGRYSRFLLNHNHDHAQKKEKVFAMFRLLFHHACGYHGRYYSRVKIVFRLHL